MEEEIRLQREYYKKTASKYDEMHVAECGEHERAMRFMTAFVDELGCQSILDIGSGTGRLIDYIKEARPEIMVIGIEPSPELREQGHSRGIGETELIDGDAQDLEFPDESFDMVCEFGALHHIPMPEMAVREIAGEERVAMITHGGFMNALLNALFGNPLEAPIFYRHHNTAISRIRMGGSERIEVQHLNRVDHLDPELVS